MRRRFDLWRFWVATSPAGHVTWRSASVTVIVGRRNWTLGVRLPRWKA